jgi:hypothetical protein
MHMDRYLGKPHKLQRQAETGNWQVDGPYYFNPKWLSPWEPKVGDWVKVTKPEITRVKGKPSWVGSMDRYDGKVLPVKLIGENGYIKLKGAVGILGLGWDFDSSWLSPAEAPKPAWEPKKGDWVTITKPTHAHRGWVSPYMDEYDGETFQFEGVFTRDSKGDPWAEGPGGYYFDLAWLSPAPVAVEPPQEPPQEAPEVPVGVTGFVGLPLDLTQDRRVASGAPEASDEDADEWRVPDVDDIGKLVQVRDVAEDDYWETGRLLAILTYDFGSGTFVCRKATPSESTYSWKHARISNKQQPEAWEPQPGDCIRVTEGSLKGHFGVVLSGARSRADQSWEPEVEDNLDFRWIWIPKLGPWTNRVHKRNLAPA